jgi:hypothetical protein
MTVTDTRLRNEVKPNGYVAWTIDGDEFHNRLMSALAALASTIG